MNLRIEEGHQWYLEAGNNKKQGIKTKKEEGLEKIIGQGMARTGCPMKPTKRKPRLRELR